jgi:hypothetical protein
MAKVKTKSAYPIFTVTLESVDGKTRIGITLRSDNKILVGNSNFSELGSYWSNLSKSIFHKKLKQETFESITLEQFTAMWKRITGYSKVITARDERHRS